MLGLDLNPSDYAKARVRGQVENINDVAEAITRQIMDNFTQQFKGRGTLNALTQFKTGTIKPFLFIDPFKVWSNGRQFQDFLEKNQEIIARNYVRKVSADLELFRAFGTTDPRKYEDSTFDFWSDLQKQQDEALKKAEEIEDPKKRKRRILEINSSIDILLRLHLCTPHRS